MSEKFDIKKPKNAPHPTQTQQGKVIFSEQDAHRKGTTLGAAGVASSASTLTALDTMPFASTALKDDLIRSDRSLA